MTNTTKTLTIRTANEIEVGHTFNIGIRSEAKEYKVTKVISSETASILWAGVLSHSIRTKVQAELV